MNIQRRTDTMKVRVKFSKHGHMIFLGHLDLMRYFQKAVRRAGIEVAFTEGFHPHPIMSFALPLSVGVESNAEYMDLEIKSSSQNLASDVSMDAACRYVNFASEASSIMATDADNIASESNGSIVGGMNDEYSSVPAESVNNICNVSNIAIADDVMDIDNESSSVVTESTKESDNEANSVVAEELTNKLNSVMVEGIEILEIVVLPKNALNAMAAVTAALYTVILPKDEIKDCELTQGELTEVMLEGEFAEVMLESKLPERKKEGELSQKISDFLARDNIHVNKKNKKGTATIDIKSMVIKLEQLNENSFSMLLKAGSHENIKPELVIKALCNLRDYSLVREEICFLP